MTSSSGVSDKWDRRFLELARFVANWSKDPSTKVGAVLVRSDRTVASVGFNGFPRGVLDHAERYADRDTKYGMIVHAEQNALMSARENVEGHTLYVVNLPPCTQCTAALIQYGIKRVVVEHPKDLSGVWAKQFETSKTMLIEAGVSVCVLEAPANDNEGSKTVEVA